MKPVNYIDASARIGLFTRVWHFSVILADVVIGQGCSIGSMVEIGTGSTIGNETRIGSHTFLPPHSRIGKRVFIGPNCTFTDDRHPRVNNPIYTAEPPIIDDDVNIGAGCVILPGVHIGTGAMIGAGSVVTRNVPAHALVYGDRAREHLSLSHGLSEDPTQYDLPFGKALVETAKS